MKKFKAGVVQFDIKKGDISYNIDNVLTILNDFSKQNVSLAVLPEMFSCGFDNENLVKHTIETENILNILSFFASKHKMFISGSMPECENNKVYNTMYLIDDNGRIAGKYRKMHLFRLTEEHLYFTSGTSCSVITTSLGKIGLMICYDLRFPEIARKLTLDGAQIILISAQWPETRKENWEVLARARAMENQIFLVCANRTGVDEELKFPGYSMILDPIGKIKAKADSKENQIISEIDIKKLEYIREAMPFLKDRKPEFYG